MRPLLEYENGKSKVNKYDAPKDIKEYLTAQRDKELETIRQWAEQ